MRAKKLTDKSVAAIKIPSLRKGVSQSERKRIESRARTYDSTLPGFGVQPFASGNKTFFVEFTSPVTGRRRRATLGRWGKDMTAGQARDRALETFRAIAQHGIDPLEMRESERRAHTWLSWSQKYLARMGEGPDARSKSWQRDCRRYLETYVPKSWNDRKLANISARDVAQAWDRVRERGPVVADRWKAAVQACFREAIRAGQLENDPTRDHKAKGVRKHESARSRVFSMEEMRKLIGETLRLPQPCARTCLLLVVMTGARPKEARSIRWDDLDFQRGVWNLARTKSGRPQSIPLPSRIAIELQKLPRESEYVFPGRVPGTHRESLKRTWNRVRTAAGIRDARLYDLRRTVGKWICDSDGLDVASRTLRHSDLSITARHYAPVADSQVRKALEKRATQLLEGIA